MVKTKWTVINGDVERSTGFWSDSYWGPNNPQFRRAGEEMNSSTFSPWNWLLLTVLPFGRTQPEVLGQRACGHSSYKSAFQGKSSVIKVGEELQGKEKTQHKWSCHRWNLHVLGLSFPLWARWWLDVSPSSKILKLCMSYLKRKLT